MNNVAAQIINRGFNENSRLYKLPSARNCPMPKFQN